MALSSSTKVGLAVQSGFTTSATSPTTSFPCDPPTFNLIFDIINDQTFRGDPVVDYDAYQGVKRVECSVDGPFYPEETGHFLKLLMGSETFTASTTAASAQHVFVGNSQPSSCSFFVTDDVNVPGSTSVLVYESCLASSFGLKWSASEGILTYTSTWTGRNKRLSNQAPGAFGTNLKPWLGWNATSATITGSSGSWGNDLLDFEITINRAPSLLYTMNNTQLAQRGDAGPIECTGRFTIDHTQPADLLDYEANADIGLTITLTRGSGTTLEALAINMPKVRVVDQPLEIQRGGVSLAVAMGFRAVGDSTIKSPIKFTLNNLRNSAYP